MVYTTATQLISLNPVGDFINAIRKNEKAQKEYNKTMVGCFMPSPTERSPNRIVKVPELWGDKAGCLAKGYSWNGGF